MKDPYLCLKASFWNLVGIKLTDHHKRQLAVILPVVSEYELFTFRLVKSWNAQSFLADGCRTWYHKKKTLHLVKVNLG